MTGLPLIRKYPTSNHSTPTPSNSFRRSQRPVWVKLKPYHKDTEQYIDSEILESERTRVWAKQADPIHQLELISLMHNTPPEFPLLVHNSSSCWFSIYSFNSPWIPYVANQSQLPFRMDSRFVRSPERGGLINLFTSSSRIKGFGIREALHYSYCRDLRFVLLFCGMLGFGIWWALSPDPLLYNPLVICSSPNPDLLCQVSRDTFIDQICSTHPQVLSPCDCGEPLNNELRELLQKPPFDPLGSISRVKGAAVFIGAILLSLALAESVSQNGVYLNI